MNNTRDTSRELRQLLDGDDPFLSGGHQILKIRRPRKKIPAWVNDKKKIRELLIRSFPKMKFDFYQRERAGRWAQIINLYFQEGWSRGQITEELKDRWPLITYDAVESIIRSIRRVSKGRRANGTGWLKKRACI
jgi:hypothetical protein